ncbi:MAG: hypothetical protein H8E85_01025 [Candidatus Marinimicrobia bacterium]|nr:hypothetical protein [Candidatus Neomarinimicrobiota bacterium]
MVKFINYIILIAFTALLSGSTIQFTNEDIPVDVFIQSETSEHIIVQFQLNYFDREFIQVNGNEYDGIYLEDEPNFLQAGSPILPHVNRSIIIPDLSGTALEIIKSESFTFDKYNVSASKGNLPRNIDFSSVPYIEGVAYQKNEFFPGEIAHLTDPYILRDYRGQVIQFNPFQYNPVTDELKVVHQMTVKISFNNRESINSFQAKSLSVKPNLDYHNMYSNQFLNYSENDTRYTPVPEDGEMLIICYDGFMNAMEPFVEWKNQKGLKATMVPVSETGTNYTSIQNYVEDYYNSHNLAYLLLVGDITQIPSKNFGGGESDIWYAYISGNDSYPEFFVGRFSAENTSHVNTQVERSIEYERDPQLDADWYSKGVLVASNEGAGYGDDGEADWQHARNMRSDLLDYTYSSVDEMYDGSHGGSDASGNPNSTTLKNALNDGRSMLHYTGHGDVTVIVTTNFNTSHVNSLTNVDKLPFVCTVGCVTGNFAGYTSLAESFQRATHNGEPSGGIASFMSTIYQGWAPPMSAQDEMVDILVESYSNNRKVTFGGVSFNGCLKMNDDYGNSGDDETDHWVIFGDPSVVLRTDSPTEISVSHSGSIEVGASTYSVNVSGGGDFNLAALSVDGEYLGSAYADNSGNAVIELEASFESDDDILLTVTGYNTTTVIESVSVGNPCGDTIMGDANGDGITNILDVIQLVNFVLDSDDASDCQFYALDLNNDNVLNIMDIILLVNEILGN